MYVYINMYICTYMRLYTHERNYANRLANAKSLSRHTDLGLGVFSHFRFLFVFQ